MKQLCIFCCLLLAFQASNATTILGMDIDQVALDAEFIFEGEVVFRETRQESGSGIISTYVTFAINDVLKGDYDADSIELKFMGGAFNGQVVQVSGLRIPEDGEQGIYFVESVSRDLINPLIGWSQGHFVIVDDNGDRRISTADDKPVTQVQSVAAIPSAIKKPQGIIEGDSDVAAGVSTDSNPIRIDRALSVPQFKAQILGIIER
ncbi:MAG: hypothetical protein HOF74_05615 [Gammaproteobacteria bacterium]|jgi:hypothetical protein|nr:hypothetical protein [Gammaproteobacteria bacterium]MBT3859288.1 hypothetical protein [Gammaproteobacteria bacterium]MBT3987978.1 hypothetical protein [Gammaproteobacteria bacterium]MBT4583067.1 hypothetical protein [Gammaproteobacteria bacterium]MBT4658032.1 hypothetical protein [Gammaproteobacteria bacterium]